MDPWGLSSARVRADAGKMTCPPFELFHWERVVIDEFTYLEKNDRAAVQRLKATYRWVLSGTPPLRAFDDVKSISEVRRRTRTRCGASGSAIGIRHRDPRDPARRTATTQRGKRPSVICSTTFSER